MSAEVSFFNFRMFDENKNTTDLHAFQGKDAIVVINCRTLEEISAKAPNYYELEDKFEKRVQILCLPGLKFLYHSHEQESDTLIDYLKAKTNIKDSDEDGLTFIINNKAHSPASEQIIYIGKNVSLIDISGEISKVLN
ncbi:hypothetical protein M9Y10_000145 [Tritrichomonas musculus]|uniref:Uncharacterized protein n=1 Tax=Tritrichomonas musculus TaxID=1915356 RepID=A0ABR2L3K6_9EUKA